MYTRDIQNGLYNENVMEEKDIIGNDNRVISYNLPNSNCVDTKIFAKLLEDSRVVASYKMYWLLGILEEVNLGNVEIQFKRLFYLHFLL